MELISCLIWYQSCALNHNIRTLPRKRELGTSVENLKKIQISFIYWQITLKKLEKKMYEIISHLIFYKEQIMSLLPHVSHIRGEWVSWGLQQCLVARKGCLLWIPLGRGVGLCRGGYDELLDPMTFFVVSSELRGGATALSLWLSSLWKWRRCQSSCFVPTSFWDSLLYRPCPSRSDSLGLKLLPWVSVYFFGGEFSCQPERKYPHLFNLSLESVSSSKVVITFCFPF